MAQNFLDADNSLMQKNLRFVHNELEDGMDKYFGGMPSSTNGGAIAPPRDYKVVTPTPGFCIKSFRVITNEKYFINVCQTDEIPAPEDITEEELSEILESEEPSSYRIPMSISEPRIAKDKSDNPVDVCDIAINPQFFAKLQKSKLFKDFFLALISEALSEKYNVQLVIGKLIILNNRKFIGNLVSHRVRNSDVKTVLRSYSNPTEADKQKLRRMENKSSTLIHEVDTREIINLKESSEQLQENSVKTAYSAQPQYKLRAKVREEQVEELQAEFHLPKCISSKDVLLDIGEDRILLSSMKCGYLFDKFVNYRLNQKRAKAIFDKTHKMLQVRIPVYPVQ